jgi:hypothetical protein
MQTSRRIVPVLAALLMGVSLTSLAANTSTGSHASTGQGAQHRAKAVAKDKHGKRAAHGKNRTHGKHKSRGDKTSTKGRHSVADQLAAHPKLAERLAPLIDKTPADMPTAVAGFKNFGQFVAAAHVSNNLGIPFDALKAEITKDGGSLGKGIQALSPEANVDAEIVKANKQAQNDLLQPS